MALIAPSACMWFSFVGGQLTGNFNLHLLQNPRAYIGKQHQQAYLLTASMASEVKGLLKPSWYSLCTISSVAWMVL